MHEMSCSEPASVRVRANKKFRSLFNMLPSETELEYVSGGSKVALLEDAMRLMGTIIEKSSWEKYSSMCVKALARGEAQKSVCAMRPANVVGDLNRFFASVQLSVNSVEHSMKIVHTFTDLSGL